MTIQDVWEAVGAEERGLLPRPELDELERTACPGAGACAGNFTATTMAVALDLLGVSAIGDGLIPADDAPRKEAAAVRAGALAVHLAHAGTCARRFLDGRALRNAMAGVAATGGSTNAVLHLLAIAREADVALSLDDLATIGAAHTGAREPRSRRQPYRRGARAGRRDGDADPRADRAAATSTAPRRP